MGSRYTINARNPFLKTELDRPAIIEAFGSRNWSSNLQELIFEYIGIKLDVAEKDYCSFHLPDLKEACTKAESLFEEAYACDTSNHRATMVLKYIKEYNVIETLRLMKELQSIGLEISLSCG